MKILYYIFALFFLCGSGLAQGNLYSSNEILIKLKDASTQSLVAGKPTIQTFSANDKLSALNQKYGVTEIKAAFTNKIKNNAVEKQYGFDRTFVLKLHSSSDIMEMVAEYNKLSDVVYAEPNYIYSINFSPNDEYFSKQWAAQNNGDVIAFNGNSVGIANADLNLAQGWDISTGSDRDTIAILDSGIDYTHPEFEGRIVAGYDFVSNDFEPMDDNGHGTACAGIAAANGNNQIGIAGVNWHCKIMPVKVVNAAGKGFSYQIANGVKYAADNGAKILSLSLGSAAHSTTLKNALDYAYAKGCVIFCSMGNGNSGETQYPAGYENTIAIGAMSPCDNRKDPTTCDAEHWWGSNYGQHIELMAPGVRIYTTDIMGDKGFSDGDESGYYATFNGTSAAAPFAAGVASLIIANRPDFTNKDIRQLMRETAVDMENIGFDIETGYGRINAHSALTVSSGGYRIAPMTIHFGDVGLRDSLSRSITLFNQTGVDRIVHFSSDDPHFSVENAVVEIPANSTVDEVLWFKPITETTYSATLSCADDDTTLSLNLSGTGVPQPNIAVSPKSFSFNLTSGDSSQAILTIENKGDLALNWKSSLSYARSSETGLFSPSGVEPYKILLLESVKWELPEGQYHSEALDNLGYPYTITDSWEEFDSLLIKTDKHWDLAIISEYTTNPYLGELDHIDQYQDNGGRLLFAYWKAGVHPYFGADRLYKHMGVDVGSVYSEPFDISAYDPSHILFKYPNQIEKIQTTQNTSQWLLNGQWIEALEGATVLMSVTNNRFLPTSILNEKRNTIYNCFQGADYRGDHDGDGKKDVVELYENQIEYLLNHYAKWLSISADSGSAAATSSSNLEMKALSHKLAPGTYSINIALTSNDPNNAVVNVPITLFVDAQKITVSVDMSLYENAGFFKPNIGDRVFAVGNFSYWQINEKYALSAAGGSVYEIEFPSYASTGDTLQYRFYIQTGDERALPNDGWEKTPGTFGGGANNRGFILTGNNAVLPTVYFNNNSSGFPEVSAAPDSFFVRINEGDSAVISIEINNDGAADLDWSISEEFYSKRSFSLNTLNAQAGNLDGENNSITPNNIKAVAGEFADLSGIKILIDQGHGQLDYTENWSVMVADLKLRGAQIYENHDSFSEINLDQYHILWTMDANVYFNDKERSAISEWVAGGGSILFEGDATTTVIVNNHLLDALNAGIEFTQENGSPGETTDIFFHPMTTNVDTIAIGNNMAQLKNIRKPAAVLVNDVYGLPNVAYSRYGNGRILVMADELFYNDRMINADNHRFANQAFDWLAFDGEYGISFSKSSGEVAPGSKEAINMKVNTKNIPGGNYTPKIVIDNNDPSKPTLKLPVNLQVIGSPVITVIDKLDFMEKGVGHTAWDTLSIYNAGTDILFITRISSNDDHFIVDDGHFVIPPISSQRVAVQFAPEDSINYNAALTIENNDITTTVALHGKGIFVPSMTLSSDSVRLTLDEGDSAVVMVQVKNTGMADLLWNAETASEGFFEENADKSFIGDKRILAFTKYLALWPDSDYEHTMNAIKQYYPDISVTKTNTTDATALATALNNKDIFLIPAQHYNSYQPEIMYQLGVSWKQVLQKFVKNGGLLIVCDFYANTVGVLNGSEIMDVEHHHNYPLHTKAKVENYHTITTGVSPVFTAPNGVEELSATDGFTVVTNQISGLPMVACKEVDKGGAVIISWDYHHVNDDINRIIANAVQWQPGKNWISTSMNSGTLATDASINLPLKINTKDLKGGIYRGALKFSSNDWEQPEAILPFKINVNEINDAPVLFSLPDSVAISQTEPASLKIWSYSYDADQPDSTLNFEFTMTPDTLNFTYEADSGWIFMEVDNHYTGLVELTVSVKDGSGAGVTGNMKIIVKEATGIAENILTGLPNQYELKQNYPNPFNPVTTIVYGLPEMAEVTLEIFNMNGQKVAFFKQGRQPAGYHKAKWNAARFSSGMYFYRLKAQGAQSFTKVKKLLLLK
jgi:subtilisin family serine protease